MKGVIASLSAAAVLAAAADAAAQGSDAVAQLSNRAAGAATGLILRLNGELQCGRLNARVFAVRLPGTMSVPASIAPASVRLGGTAPLRVAVRSHAVSLTMPLRPTVTCDSITLGWFAISFARSAGLRNPRAAGSYAFTVSASPAGAWRGTIAVG